ncbi:MAG: zinc-binding alcohol dehydrogenase family protein [Acidobacteria bacterium]|nr:zinc-binding alcohol dehydrogenase family protein [Acidobacteriota bacterium]
MKAIKIQSHGGPEVLSLTSLPDPVPGQGEILVRVKASAVNPLDGIVRMGYFPIAKQPPLILGEEASGVVERDGGGFMAGETVIVYGGGLGVFTDGTWAELIAVPAAKLRRIPAGIAIEEVAALPNAGVTAYGALRTAELKAGERLLVLGATGGVGSAGAHIGRAMGATVIAVVSTPEKGAALADLGANHVVALNQGPLEEQVRKLTDGRGADVVLDPVGGELTGRGMAALGASGRLVHLGYSAGMSLSINSLDLIAKKTAIQGFNIFLVDPDRAARDLDEVVALIAQRKYRAIAVKTFPASEVVAATRWLDERRSVGKVVLAF